MSTLRITLLFVATSALLACSTETEACNTVGLAHLGSAEVDKIEADFYSRREALNIEETATISTLTDYFMDLGGSWRRPFDTPSTLNGAIRFYSKGEIVEAVWVAPTTFMRGGCYRDVEPMEYEQFVRLLGVSKEDFEK